MAVMVLFHVWNYDMYRTYDQHFSLDKSPAWDRRNYAQLYNPNWVISCQNTRWCIFAHDTTATTSIISRCHM